MKDKNIVVQAARLKLISRRPYLARAVYAMVAVPTPGLGTMAVDQFWRLYFDPDIGSKWSAEQVAGVLYHEVLHLLRNHPERMLRCSASREMLNIAADLEINDDLQEEGITLPEGGIFPDKMGLPRHLTAEEYLSLLGQNTGGNNPDDPSDGSGNGDPGDDDRGDDDPGDGGSGNHAQGNHDPGNHAGEGGADQEDGLPRPGAGRCGSCATGKKEAWELPAPDGGNPGLSEMEAEIVRRQVAQEVREASKARGDIPGHMRRWADELIRPKVDWRKKLRSGLRGALMAAGMDDYTYSRPSRRASVVFPVILPGMRRRNPEVVMIIDTSGSMSDRKVAQALAEVQSVLMHFCSSVTVIAADAATHFIGRVSSIKQLRPHLLGGGGTNMEEAIAQAERLRPKATALIVLTDGYTPWPSEAPKGMKVVVGLILDKDEARPQVPSWATVVEIR